MTVCGTRRTRHELFVLYFEDLEGLGSPSSFQVTAGQHAAVYTALYDYDGKG